MNPLRRTLLAGAGLLSGSIGVAPALAQVAPAAANSGNESEIVVTAQKRSERLIDVPISITAASGEELASRGVKSVADLSKIAPGFTYQPSAYDTPVYTIRGVGFLENSIAVAPTVTVYVDQVPLPYSAMTIGASLDLERVEVLKGPQGTLFGQNSTGGAINYIAAKPTREPHAGLDLGYGRFNTFEANGYVSGPLGHTVAARLSVRTEQGGDWQKSQTRHDSAGQRDFLAGRLLLDWTPSDDLRFELNLNGWRDKGDIPALQFVSFAPTNPATPFLAAFAELINMVPAPNNARVADWNAGFSLARDDSFYQASLRADWDVAGLTATSITAYAKLKRDGSGTDSDGTAFPNFSLTSFASIESFTQELRIGDQSGVRPFKWLLGANYQHDKSSDSPFVQGRSTNTFPIFETTVGQNNQTHRSIGVFGSVDYEIVPRLTLQGSIRYTDYKIRSAGCLRDTGDGGLAAFGNLLLGPGAFSPGDCIVIDTTTFTPAGVIEDELKQDNVSWRASISWKPNDDALLYANVTRGYKAGSYTTNAALFSDQFKPDTQESILAYEAGLKASLMDRTLQFAGAVFYYDYDDKQLLGYKDFGPLGNLPALVSIPKSSVQGAELSITWRPVERLRLTGGGTYIKSKVKSSFTTNDPFAHLVDVKGEAFPNTPKWQLTGDVQYDVPLWSGGTGFIGASVQYRSSSVAAFGGSPQFVLPEYALVDLRAGLETHDGAWRLEIYGRNITNKFYLLTVQHLTDTVVRQVGMPVTYGARVSFRF
ncbi:MAG TPA: TonB-dependent receptor [Allosphingosinicella sp.]|nr:TonB-dependent receptor [Allosphingosinicella sp.]